MSHRTIPVPDVPTSKGLRTGIVLGGICGMLGVVLMAMSAHMDTTGLLRTAAEMLLFHAPAFLVLGALSEIRRIPLLKVTFVLMALGLCLFCGDLAMRSFTGNRLFPMAAPTGGMLTIASWASIILSVFRIYPRT